MIFKIGDIVVGTKHRGYDFVRDYCKLKITKKLINNNGHYYYEAIIIDSDDFNHFSRYVGDKVTITPRHYQLKENSLRGSDHTTLNWYADGILIDD